MISVAFFILDSIALVRYIFIFWLKNPAAFKDEFWAVYINIWCLVISVLFQVLRAIIPGNQLVEYCLCTGEDPTPIILLPSFGRGYIESFSLIFQILIYAKIWFYKRKAKKVIGPQVYSSYLKNVFIVAMDKDVISSLATDIVAVLVLAFGSVFIMIVNFKNCEDFQLFPKFIVVYYTYMLYPCLSCVIITMVWFIKNPVLRHTIVQELKSLIREEVQ